MKENTRKIKQLNEENKDFYIQTKLLLRRDVKKRSERKTVLKEFFDLLSDAQERGVSSKELFSEGYDVFYRDLISGLTTYPVQEARKRVFWRRALAVSLFILGVTTILLQYFAWQGYIGVWTQGISYIATDFNHYTYEASPLQEEVSFTINFRNWEKYKNVVIYRNGDITVELEKLDETDGRYRIFFRAHGIYSRDYAAIVSWRKYAFDASHTAEWMQTGELFCDYGGERYACRLLGFTNMDDKDGEEFGFYVPAAISPQGFAGTAEFYLRNLTQSFWKRKTETTVIT